MAEQPCMTDHDLPYTSHGLDIALAELMKAGKLRRYRKVQ